MPTRTRYTDLHFRFTFTHNNVRQFYTSGFDLGEAFEKLNVPVKNFKVYGDLPGEVINRLNRKFGVVTEAGNSPDDNNDDGGRSRPTSTPTAPHRDPTGQSRNSLADIVKSMVDKDPGDKKMAEIAEEL